MWPAGCANYQFESPHLSGDLLAQQPLPVLTERRIVLNTRPSVNTPRGLRKHLLISLLAFFFIGIYGGFINAGIGFVIMLFLHYYNRLNLIKVNATKVVIVLIYTTGAIVTFAIAGKINWIYALFLASGNFLGGWVSSRWSVKKGEKVIKLFLLIMVFIMSVRLWFFNN